MSSRTADPTHPSIGPRHYNTRMRLFRGGCCRVCRGRPWPGRRSRQRHPKLLRDWPTTGARGWAADLAQPNKRCRRLPPRDVARAFCCLPCPVRASPVPPIGKYASRGWIQPASEKKFQRNTRINPKIATNPRKRRQGITARRPNPRPGPSGPVGRRKNDVSTSPAVEGV